jgi:AhpD family alkylhydroperoxidase
MPNAESLSVSETFEQIEQELGAGMVPRIFRLLESQPELLNHLWGQFRTLVLRGSLPRILKEMLGLVVATATHCDYVQVVHLHSLSLQGVDQKALEAVIQGDYGASEINALTRSALQFAKIATETRAAYATPTESGLTWQELRQQSSHLLDTMPLEAEEKLEVIAIIALFEQICTVANLLALDPNQP